MNYYVTLPLLLLVALIEAAVLPMFRIGGLQPDLMLVLLVAWLMVRGAAEAFVLVPIAGIFLGLVDGAPMGAALIALAPIAILHEVRGAHLAESGLLLTVAFTTLMTLVFHAAYLAVYTLDGTAGSWSDALLRVAIPVSLLNVAVLLPVYAVLSATSKELRRPAYV
jgi:cell shape-determining protein MreD